MKFSENLKKIDLDFKSEVKSLCDVQIVEKVDENLVQKNIVFSPEIYREEEIQKLKEKCEKCGKDFYLDLPNFALENDIKFLKELIAKTMMKIVANNMYSLGCDTDIVVGGGLNVFNTQTANYYGKSYVVAEGDVGEKIDFPYMTLRHCPMKSNLGATCDKCPYADGYYF